MNKELIIKNTKKIFKGDLQRIVLNQTKDYFELAESDYRIKNGYKIGDDVILNENHLLHGIGKHTDIIKEFAERGIVSPDYFGSYIEHAFCYEAAFWNVKSEIKLKDYIINYSGIIAKYNNSYEQVPYKKLDDFVEKMKEVNPFKWTSESSMEIRFMPSLAKNDNQIGFIVNTENEVAQKLRKNSVFKETFNKRYALKFVNPKSKNKFKKEGFVGAFFDRADYIIFGIPKNCIEGIIVGRIVENSEKYLKQLKDLFPNCYICNLDGKVIMI